MTWNEHHALQIPVAPYCALLGLALTCTEEPEGIQGTWSLSSWKPPGEAASGVPSVSVTEGDWFYLWGLRFYVDHYSGRFAYYVGSCVTGEDSDGGACNDISDFGIAIVDMVEVEIEDLSGDTWEILSVEGEVLMLCAFDGRELVCEVENLAPIAEVVAFDGTLRFRRGFGNI